MTFITVFAGVRGFRIMDFQQNVRPGLIQRLGLRPEVGVW